MKPCGITIAMALASKCCTLLEVGKSIKKALEFVHENGFYHNDVSPTNIMYDCGRSCAFLIDFGLATGKDKDLCGFFGTAIYTHCEIFGQYPKTKWRCKPEYDYASLAFSMAALSSGGGKCPWKPVSPPDAKNNKEWFTVWVETRAETAWECLDGKKFDKAVWKPRCFSGIEHENEREDNV